jgi:tricorn protease interacting factor F2/3
MEYVKPINYDISFDIDLEKFKFYGKEKIQIEISKPVKSLTLNSKSLAIRSCSLSSKGKIIKPSFVCDDKKEELVLKMPEDVSGEAELLIYFEGELKDELVGLYRSKYEVDGKEKYLATTHFEATDARRAFPCWDNPSCKATFDISIKLDSRLTAISNTPAIEEKEIGGNKKLFRFERTPKMSTYLVYISAGEFEFLEDKLGGIKLRVYTTPGKKIQGEFALDCMKKFLNFYENYFGIKYPLGKLDLIALPDFAAGAMENWGAITFRETALLYDPKKSSVTTKQYIAEVISHELVHMWFGDLVTMKWWDDLWLNESFATFISYKAVAKFYPEWEMWSQFLHDKTASALQLDSFKSSHPVQVEVHTPSEISSIFDRISYEKGASILRMLECFLGEDKFKLGLRNYLLSYSYGNATTTDFWNAFEKASKKPVRKMMDGWIKQVGYPLVEADLKNSKLHLSQKRFLLEKGAKPGNSLWMIPISLKLEKKVVKHVLEERDDVLEVGKTKWFKLNFDQSGFYRTKHPKEDLDRLKELVAKNKFSSPDRWGIQNDLFALVVSGENPLNEYLDFIEAYLNENDYLLVKDIVDKLYYVYLLTSDEKFWQKIKKYNKEFLINFFKEIGWEPKKNERDAGKILRSVIIINLARLDDKKILKKSEDKFREFLDSPESLHPDIRGAVYSSVAWKGGKKNYDKMLELYLKEKSQEERRRFLIAMCGFKDKGLSNKALDLALSKEVRPQDIFLPPMGVSSNPYGRNLVWKWVKENWKEIKSKSGAAKNILNTIVESAEYSSDKDTEDDMTGFFKKNPTPEIKMALVQTLESIRINRKFLESTRKIKLQV